MPNYVPPLAPTNRNAPFNNDSLAQEYRDRPFARIHARRSAHQGRCMCCNRRPPSNELCEIILDPASGLIARIGIGRCHFSFFRGSLERFLAAEIAGRHPQRRRRIRHLRGAIRRLPRKLP